MGITQCGHDKCEELAANTLDRLNKLLSPLPCIKKIYRIPFTKIIIQVLE